MKKPIKAWAVLWRDKRDGELFVMECDTYRFAMVTKLEEWRKQSERRKAKWEFIIRPVLISLPKPKNKLK